MFNVLDEDGIKSWGWRKDMTFTKACQLLAADIPLITVVPYMQHMLTLKENDVYSIKGYPELQKIAYHVVVLIGGLR